MRAESPNPAVPVADRDRAGPMNKHVSIRATCLKRSALSTTKEGISYSRSKIDSARPTRPQWNTHPALRPWGGGCVLPVRPGSGGGPAPPRALCGWRRRGRLRYGHSRAGPLRDRGRPSRLEGGRRAPTRDGLTVVMYTCRLRAGAHPPPRPLTHSTTRVAAPTVSHATGARARPRLRLRSPGRDRVPGRTVPAADTPRRRAAAETATVAGGTRARRTARVQRASHRPRTRVEAGASCYGASHVDRTSDVLRSDSSTTKRGTAVRCTTGVFRSSVRMY